MIGIFKRKPAFPRYFHEFSRARLKAKLGQTFNGRNEPEIVIQFHYRDDNWRWKKIGTFRYLDGPDLRRCLDEMDRYVRGLVTSD